MRSPRSVLCLFALALALVAAACGDAVARPSAADVNGQEISAGELQEELDAIQSNAAYVEIVEQGGTQIRGSGRGTLSNEFVGRVLTRQIFLELIHQELVRRKLAVTPAELAAVEPDVVQSTGGEDVYRRFPAGYRDTLKRRNAEVAKLQQILAGPAADDAAIRRFYEENPELFAQTCVSHILFAVLGEGGQIDQAATAAAADQLRTQADAVRAQIAAGEDFAALAAQHSVDAGSKANGGSLECGPAGRFVPEFEIAMDALPIDGVSDPVQTQFGFHIIKVTGRQPQSLEEATPLIQQRLEGESQEGLSAFLQQALADSDISVNPRYGRFVPDGPAPGIVPPDAPTTTAIGDEATDEQIPNPLAP